MGVRRGGNSGKRGVSPLIATVLLVAFAITIGALVMGWGQNMVETQADNARETGEREIRCSVGISLQVKTVAGERKLCFRNTSATVGQVEFMLENNGDTTVEGIQIVIIGDNDESENYDLNTFQIIGGGVKKGTQTFSYSTLGNISQVEFIPKVINEDSTVAQICTNKRLEEDGIFECD